MNRAQAQATTRWLMLVAVAGGTAATGMVLAGWLTGRVELAAVALPLLVGVGASGWLWQRRTQARACALDARVAALTESERRARAIAACSSEGVLVFENGRILDCNEATLAMFGYDAQALLTLLPEDLAASEDRDTVRTRLAQHVDDPAEMQAVRRDGSTFPVSVVAREYVFDGRRVRITSLRDLTLDKAAVAEQQRARYAAESAARFRSEFLANMSHEMRTPLGGIIGVTELLLETAIDATQRRYAEMVQASGEHLLRLISDVLDLSKIDAGKLDLELGPVDLAALVARQTAAVLPRASQKQLVVQTLLDPRLPAMVMGDASRLNQVLLNFLDNAIKFTAVGTVTLRVQVEHEDDTTCAVRFSVSDTGMGIAPETQARLFTPFTQADGSTARRFGGTGLGLSICKQLAVLMHGQVGVDSELGQGATFWFTVPLPKKAVPAARPTLAAPSESGPAGIAWASKKVLVAEDNQVNQLLVLTHLKKLGYEAQAVNNGTEVLQALEAQTWDLVLMDCQMPEMDGFAATAAIRTRENVTHQHTPVIALTANAMQDDRERCLRAGMDDYITKPVKRDALARLLHQYLGAPTPPEHAARA